MWKRFHRTLRCPVCVNQLELTVFQCSARQLQDDHLTAAREKGLLNSEFNQYVDEGVLLCDECKLWFPISGGLPILLTYKTQLHDRFVADFSEQLSRLELRRFDLPHGEPVTGEQFVLESFSKEWVEYKYDGVLWEANYQDLEQRFLREMNPSAQEQINLNFLEVGCGLGITTYLAQKNYCVDAVGVDLSHSVLQASKHYKENPFLHFVQASVFHLPFEKISFDSVYSRGVLHHTFSTYEAFKSLSSYCRPGGCLYLWVYGKRSIDDNHFRVAAYSLESVLRPILSERPDSTYSKVLLALMALGYLGLNKLRRIQDPRVQTYDFGRAVHAARDRFTPKYAHRHESTEISEWFKELGFTDVEIVDWKVMPTVEQDDYRRNIGVRGRRLQNAAPE